ncbi:MAG: pyridoxal-5'-phosphate-dependent protein subunit beta [Actinobacteria bacterium RBG_19FT_COMBO_70_19]|nr:MAG: pyridoxal-5'-phosphate-dependent protein subunit beta [Actinobacteria bacterium RBG_19FT_COMBO_70_19]
MERRGLPRAVTDASVLERTVERFREAGVALPTFGELADPTTIPDRVIRALDLAEPDAANPLNLFRVHWYNGSDRRARVPVPEHVVLPSALTGVEARIVVALGDRFPMIGAHKVLAAYGCLVPEVVTGAFDPTTHRAVWPSTGNYCRGGVAISRIMGCRGVAVLPEGMSRERFEWLERWVADPVDIIRTPGVESNVREIYDECKRLAQDRGNAILNQFSEYPNHLVHELVTGRALAHVFETMKEREPGLRLRAFVSATGSAGTIAAGDHLKDRFGTAIVAAEALECPTLLRNGFGEHNIQGIGDKHVPLIHNVMNTDVIVDISDRDTDALNVLFNTVEGKNYLRARGVDDDTIAALDSFGLSSICNVLGAIKVARLLRLGPDDVIVTIATDGAAMYRTEVDKVLARDFPDGFGPTQAAETFGRSLEGQGTDDMLELTLEDRERIFNLGYFTWVEQQGVSIEDFEVRRSQDFWRGLRDAVPHWDDMIREVNARTGVLEAL